MQLINVRTGTEILRSALEKTEGKGNILLDHVSCFCVQKIWPLYHRLLNVCLVGTTPKGKVMRKPVFGGC